MALYQTILLSVNPDDIDAHKLMIKAGVVAEQNNAELHIVYVEPGVGNVSYMDVELELEESHNDLELKRISQLSALSKQSPYPVRAVHIADGGVANHVIELAEKIRANLVMTGYHKNRFHWCNDISHEVAQKLKCDVMILQ